MPFDTDVLICGAGAAGLTLAIDLARRGVRLILIEQNPQPFGGSRGKGIQPRTMEIFEDLGIVDRVAAAGGPYPPQREYRADGSSRETVMTELPPSSPAEPYAGPLMVPQFKTEGVMRERLAELGYRPQFGQRMTGDSVLHAALPCQDQYLDRDRMIGLEKFRSLPRRRPVQGQLRERNHRRAFRAFLRRSVWPPFRRAYFSPTQAARPRGTTFSCACSRSPAMRLAKSVCRKGFASLASSAPGPSAMVE